MNGSTLFGIFVRLFHKSFLPAALVTSFVMAPSSRGADVENANDTPDGAEVISGSGSRSGYSIQQTDADWFLIRKGRCDTLEIFLESSNTSALDGAMNLGIYTDEATPQRITSTETDDDPNADVRRGRTIASITYAGNNVTSVYVRVYGSNLENSSDSYDIDFTVRSSNGILNRKISKLTAKLKKMQKRAKRARLPGAKQAYAKRIKDSKKKIKSLKRRLCK